MISAQSSSGTIGWYDNLTTKHEVAFLTRNALRKFWAM
jgi:hypothetical protein